MWRGSSSIGDTTLCGRVPPGSGSLQVVHDWAYVYFEVPNDEKCATTPSLFYIN